MKLRILALLIITSLSFTIHSNGQSGIRFYKMDVKAGIIKAKQENKFLFVDTYAVWCIPCKKMKKVFANNEVAKYFNDHYVNIKIDMDGPNGKKTYNDYDVIFLPTMMIFDHEGRIKYKTDKLLTAQELLNIGVQANVDGVYLGNNASQIVSAPFQKVAGNNPKSKKQKSSARKAKKQITKPTEPSIKDVKSEGQIVQVIGADDEMPPEVLYEEAYYQMQRMENQQGEAALAYLETQSDWSTEKNVKFIYDFVETTKSPLFDYIKNNRAHVASIVGEANLSHSLDILVNQRIYQGYPRPELNEAIALYNLVDTNTAKGSAYQYYLIRMQQEGDKKSYLSTLNEYLTEVAPNDHIAMDKGAAMYATMNYNNSEWNMYYDQINKAISLDPSEAKYHLTLAKLYLQKGDTKRAKKSVENAQEIINENTGDLDGEITEILEKINRS